MMKKSAAGLIWIFVIVFVLAFFIQACTDNEPAAPTATVDVNGVTRDEQGYIVPNALVEAVSSSGKVLAYANTDEMGSFNLTGVSTSEKDVQLRISHDDFKLLTMKLPTVVQTGTAGDPLLIHVLHKDSACAHLALLIRDVHTLTAISNAEVRLKRNGTLVTTVQSDQFGRVEFNYVMAGTYSIRVSKSGYQVIERQVTVQYCDTVSMDLRMEPSGTSADSCCHGILTIFVRDSSTNALLNGVAVKLSKDGMDTRLSTTCNGQPAIFGDLCPGEYHLRLALDGYNVQEFSVVLACNQAKDMTRYLVHKIHPDSCCHGTITVLVADSATNTALANTTVKLWYNNALLKTLTTDANGYAVFTEKCNGEYQISVLREHYKSREYSFTLGCNEQKSIPIALKAESTTPDTCCTAILKVRVKDSTIAEAGWLNDVMVTVALNGVVVRSGYTNSEGYYMESNLCAPGVYTITFTKQGYQTKTWTVHFTTCKTYTETIRLHP
jgi:uncharacterized surface anchored protein